MKIFIITFSLLFALPLFAEEESSYAKGIALMQKRAEQNQAKIDYFIDAYKLKLSTNKTLCTKLNICEYKNKKGVTQLKTDENGFVSYYDKKGEMVQQTDAGGKILFEKNEDGYTFHNAIVQELDDKDCDGKYKSPFWSSIQDSMIDVSLRGGRDDRRLLTEQELRSNPELNAVVDIRLTNSDKTFGAGTIVAQGECEILVALNTHQFLTESGRVGSPKQLQVKYLDKTLDIKKFLKNPNFVTGDAESDWGFAVAKKTNLDCKNKTDYHVMTPLNYSQRSVSKSGEIKTYMICKHYPKNSDPNRIYGKLAYEECVAVEKPSNLKKRYSDLTLGFHTCDTNDHSSGCSILTKSNSKYSFIGHHIGDISGHLTESNNYTESNTVGDGNYNYGKVKFLNSEYTRTLTKLAQNLE